ncbi:MAG TPA: iron ABC transporter substrate-binding protein [Acidimicrobiaceae bacterium]|nr:iron ABC transporter substrate-binding protein [Acidimicrobiaceae bacterium]
MRTHTLRRTVAIVAVSGLTLVAAACGDDESSSTTEAPGTSGAAPDSTAAASGSITVYSGRSEELVMPLLEQFTAATGIEVEFRGGDSGELAAQLLTEGDASPADVFFSQDAGALGAVENAGLFTALPSELLEIVPAAYESDAGMWVGTSGRVRVLVVNPELVPDAPTTIDELLDPQWKGKIGFAPTNASWQAFVTGLRVLRGDDGAREWLEGFAANEPVAYEKNGAVRDAVNAGEVALGLVNHYYLYELIAAEGQDAVVAVNQFMAAGDPGGLVNVAGVGVLASSDNQAAALALVEFLLSEEGQTYFANNTYEYPLREGVSPQADLPALADLAPPALDLTELDSLAETQEMLAEVGLLTL